MPKTEDGQTDRRTDGFSALYSRDVVVSLLILSITLSHALGPAKKAEACRAGNHYLYCELNDLNAEKSQPSGDLNG